MYVSNCLQVSLSGASLTDHTLGSAENIKNFTPKYAIEEHFFHF